MGWEIESLHAALKECKIERDNALASYKDTMRLASQIEGDNIMLRAKVAKLEHEKKEIAAGLKQTQVLADFSRVSRENIEREAVEMVAAFLIRHVDDHEQISTAWAMSEHGARASAVAAAIRPLVGQVLSGEWRVR